MSTLYTSGPVDPKRCVAEVWRDANFHQCANHRREGGDWCGVHNPQRVKARQDARDAQAKTRKDRARATAWRMVIDELRPKDPKLANQVAWFWRNRA